MKHFLGNSKHAGNRRWQPYLRVDCILACAVERLNVQMLFDPFEETFYLQRSL